jgi:hypothetical protein
MDIRIDKLTKQLLMLSNQQTRCRQFKTVFSIGPMTSTLCSRSWIDPTYYKNSRKFAAFLGIAPR